jgi:hypothetical protein
VQVQYWSKPSGALLASCQPVEQILHNVRPESDVVSVNVNEVCTRKKVLGLERPNGIVRYDLRFLFSFTVFGVFENSKNHMNDEM